ncbi:hypothetical protein KXR53_17110 [Inquilinus limosus]|uniref:hypothetical protein n=1 Tax=Inquilinus limosus TaxID=171674 RepID=UPI003F15769F
MAVTVDQISVEITAVVGQYNQAMIQVAAVTTRNMAAAEGAAKKGSAGIEKALEAVAARVPGLVKGLIEGENALQLFLGEAAQLLPIFGPWGTVLAAAADVLSALIERFDLFGESAEEAVSRATRGFDKVRESLRGVLDDMEVAGLGFDDLAQKSKDAMDRAKTEADNTANAIAAIQKEIAGAGFGIRGGAIGERIRAYGGEAADRKILSLLEEIESKAPISAQRLGEIRQRLSELGAQVLSGKDDVEVLTSAIDQNKDKVFDLEKWLGTLLRTMERLQSMQNGATEAAYGFGRGLEYAADRAGFLRNAVDALAEVRASMLPKGGLSFGGQSATFATTDLQTALADLAGRGLGTDNPGAFGIPPRSDAGGLRPKAQRKEEQKEQDRQADQLDADHTRAEQLTKSVMTAQEKYNESLAEYNRLRDEGFIGEEAYLRLRRDLNAENNGYVEGIQAIGQAIEGGIQGATSFSDALLKIGTSLAQLIAQAALFGQGPLGKLFDSLFGTSGGIFNLAGAITGSLGGGLVQPAGSPIAVPIPGRPPGMASGGQALPGRIYEVGETGREWFAPSVPGQVIPNSVIKAAAGGGTGSGPPITFNISLAGANGDRTIAEIAAGAVKKGLQQVPEINRQHRIRFA